ncbi:juvenile hormone esterase-like [Diabrotica virgifera virgifera]|uniref:Carboxylesterase type B domain-containing protein n=1 Tax=Diabrotica virgifera virgifera TaxID=50390 RepID=A0ABM5JZA1_DIAVI|nr:juvenile hormone esterase-like [Diabrotica virgifera virgifera]
MWLKLFCVLWVIVGLYVYKDKENIDFIVQLPDGKIQGHILRSENGRHYYAFQEIPYAAPPIGENRFQEPKEPEPWDGIRSATRNEKVCLQLMPIPSSLRMSEDCLYLNVYSPVSNLNFTNPTLPVLMYIHGGIYKFESGAFEYYNPRFLMDHDIIIVTINYRLGPFGFLATSDGVIPGNLGIKDTLLALKWVHKNINLFGGDKDQITLMGHSVGAMCLGNLQMSPLTKGLVKGYIMASGSPLNPLVYQDDPDIYAFDMGKAVDKYFNSTNTQELLHLLQAAPAEIILQKPLFEHKYNHSLTKNLIWAPSIEPEHENAVITGYMLEQLSSGDFEKAPMLISTALEEAVGTVSDINEQIQDASYYDKDVRRVINPRLNVPPENLAQAGREYRRVYTSSNFSNDLPAFLKYLGEELFSTPIIHHAVVASAYVPVYFYQFSYKGPMGHTKPLDVPGIGNVGHGEELAYIFGGQKRIMDDLNNYPESDILTMQRMLKIITNFVKYQNPTPAPDDLLDGVVWPQFRKDTLLYININNSLEIKQSPKHYIKVRRVLDKYRQRPFIVF